MSIELDQWSDDFMNRRETSLFLTKYLLLGSDINVLNLNSPWGSGKTFFISKWQEELSQKYICIYFNAWENDYSSEPLVALVSAIRQQTLDSTSLSKTSAGEALVNTSRQLLKTATPLITKGLVKKYIGVELDELIGQDGADAAEKIVEGLIKEQEKTAGNISSFKKSVKACLESAALNKNKDPDAAFIFIDELDRCRPTYAIELLERIKHFFGDPKLKFVVASDSEQLANSICAIYGEKFDSKKYLHRFFDADFSLDNSNIFGMILAKFPPLVTETLALPINITGKPTAISGRDIVLSDKYTIKGEDGTHIDTLTIAAFVKAYSLDLRSTLRCIKQIRAIEFIMPGKEFHLFWCAFLVFTKFARPDIYGKINSLPEFKDSTKNQYHLNFHMYDHLASMDFIAQFYVEIFVAEIAGTEIQNRTYNSWQSVIMRSYRLHDIQLSKYKAVVDMAARLE